MTAFIVLSVVLSSAAQRALDTQRSFDAFGISVAAAGLVDDDKVEDFIIGDPVPTAKTKEAGCAWVVSGVSGSVLEQIVGPEGDAWFGSCVAAVRGPAISESGGYVVSSLSSMPEYALDAERNALDNGRVYFVNRQGRVVKRLTGDPGRRLGRDVQSAGDINGDGYCDILVSAPWASGGAAPGVVRLYSGASLDVLCEVSSRLTGDAFASRAIVSAASSSTGDRLLVCSGGRAMQGSSPCIDVFRIRCAKSPEVTFMYSIPGGVQELAFGRALLDIGDLNGDGYPELAIGSPELLSLRAPETPLKETKRGRVLIISGRNGDVIKELSHFAVRGQFGSGLSMGRATDPIARSLVVSAAVNAGPAGQGAFLTAFTLGEWSPAFRTELGVCGGVTLTSASGGEQLLTARSDCDPSFNPGCIAVCSAIDGTIAFSLRREDVVKASKGR